MDVVACLGGLNETGGVPLFSKKKISNDNMFGKNSVQVKNNDINW
jgi:hypothetical protein